MTQQMKLAAVSEGTIPEDQLLGRITFFSLPDEPVRVDELVRAWTNNGLDPDGLEVRRPEHVFQSACGAIKGKRDHLGERVEVKADCVEDNAERCTYQITRMKWDLDNRVIDHEKAMRLEFDKAKATIRSERLDFFSAELADLEDQVRGYYEDNMGTVAGSKIRNTVRKLLISEGGQNLRRGAGGVYFVPSMVPGNGPSLPTLAGLQQALVDLYGDRGDLYTVPCVNGEGEREMIRKHTTINLRETAQRITADVYSRLREGSERAPRQDFVNRLYTERRQILQTLDHFKDLVAMEEGDVMQSIAELDEALGKLIPNGE